MKLILLQDVGELGGAGQVVSVKEGYARNFLIPKKMGLPATAQNLKLIELENKKRAEAKENEKLQAQRLAERICGLSCTVAVETSADDKLFGSVTTMDIQRALETEGIIVDRKKIGLQEHIGHIGIYQVPIRLHPDICVDLKLWVVRK